MKLKALIWVFSILILVAGLLYFSPNNAFAQACATDGSPGIQSAGWARGTRVSVFIDPGITGDARSATEQAFRNWNDASGANNSGVVYEFTTTRPISGVGNYLIVSYGSNLVDPRTNAQVRAQVTYNSDPATGYTTRGGIRLDESMSDYGAVLETMVHEIGHPMGMDHCEGTGCTRTSSVMTLVVINPPSPANFNRTYGRSTVPTDCDNQTLQAVNYPPCFPPIETSCSWDINLCACRNTSGGGGLLGGGDGGGYYHCTPYYWVVYQSWDNGKTWEIIDVSYAGCW